jgi:predicted ferric reductase
MRRPNFVQLLQETKRRHAEERSIGVFACGPPGLVGSLAAAIRQLNARELGPSLHYYEEQF